MNTLAIQPAERQETEPIMTLRDEAFVTPDGSLKGVLSAARVLFETSETDDNTVYFQEIISAGNGPFRIGKGPYYSCFQAKRVEDGNETFVYHRDLGKGVTEVFSPDSAVDIAGASLATTRYFRGEEEVPAEEVSYLRVPFGALNFDTKGTKITC